jgi:hypothetical protein
MVGPMGLELVPVSDDAAPLSYWYRVPDLPWSHPERGLTKSRRMIPF